MKEDVRNVVEQLLDDYLVTNNLRRTPERYATLGTIYSIEGHFFLEELGEYLIGHNFRVSRATLYNSLRLFRELRFMICHRLQDDMVYESCYDDKDHCHQICTTCGRVSEVNLPVTVKAMNETKLKRFRKDGFTLYIYGVYSTYQALITRKRMSREKTRNIRQNE